MPTVRVYSRRGCHLCEQLIEEIIPLVRGRAQLEILDIDTREDWRQSYGTRIPVVEIEGRVVCQHALEKSALAAVITAE